MIGHELDKSSSDLLARPGVAAGTCICGVRAISPEINKAFFVRDAHQIHKSSEYISGLPLRSVAPAL
ncbi:Hypothetical predicted protein [Cloeon dipterum]|uniref:Uncharacterized protein n=1 Tax=Cloeon dipterum TaxID=197152 RepID=A0A8S1CT39_9INSE|nr:Hypothetical predicted protein [Cloeon dipterum]